MAGDSSRERRSRK